MVVLLFDVLKLANEIFVGMLKAAMRLRSGQVMSAWVVYHRDTAWCCCLVCSVDKAVRRKHLS